MKFGFIGPCAVACAICFMASAVTATEQAAMPDTSPNLDIFQPSSIATDALLVPAGTAACGTVSPDPCKQVTIFAPTVAGSYPLLLFQHGFQIVPADYSQLLSHIASWGFVVVAPQMYFIPNVLKFLNGSATQEIEDAGSVLIWAKQHANDALKADPRFVNVSATVSHVGIFGHSRGGKVAVGLSKHLYSGSGRSPAALAAIDPVDGTGQPFGGNPCTEGTPTLPYLVEKDIPPFRLSVPFLVMGTELGSSTGGFPKNCPCAPAPLGHAAFYEKTLSLKYHALAKGAGHMDMLNDKVSIWTSAASLVCVEGKLPRETTRNFVGGWMVSYFKTALSAGDLPEMFVPLLKEKRIAGVDVEVSWASPAA